MEDDEEFCFTIYHMPVHFEAPVRGRERFLRERAFLDDLVAPKVGRHKKQRPVPDPPRTSMLDDDELDAYSTFRHRMDAESKRG
jgi:hypothetical protein